jgi:hypothetical protein
MAPSGRADGRAVGTHIAQAKRISTARLRRAAACLTIAVLVLTGASVGTSSAKSSSGGHGSHHGGSGKGTKAKAQGKKPSAPAPSGGAKGAAGHPATSSGKSGGGSGKGSTHAAGSNGGGSSKASPSGGQHARASRHQGGGGSHRSAPSQKTGATPASPTAHAAALRRGTGNTSAFAGVTPVGILGAATRSAPRARAHGFASLPAAKPMPAASSPIVHTVREFVEVIPPMVWLLVGVLAVMTLLLAARSGLLAGRHRGLQRQREVLLEDMGVLQRALLSPPPEQIAGVSSSVAYLSADARGAGGDFNDVFALEGERLGVVVGDLSARDRGALGLAALVRHTLRAYLEAGMEPRAALEVGSRVLADKLGEIEASVTLAIYHRDTGRLVYASAGHPPPVVLGTAEFEPILASASPALGGGRRTGMRQTTLALPPGSRVCFYTRGLVEARVGDEPFGYRRLSLTLTELAGAADAGAVLDRVAAQADVLPEDFVTCVLHVAHHVPATHSADGIRRIEELELSREELEGTVAAEFLTACGLPSDSVEALAEEFRATGLRLGGAVLQVRMGPGVPHAELGLRRMDMLPSFAA